LVAFLLDCAIVKKEKESKMHKILDYFGCPRASHREKNLGLFGRVTFGWLWTDDPEVDRIHAEQDIRDGRE